MINQNWKIKCPIKILLKCKKKCVKNKYCTNIVILFLKRLKNKKIL